MSALDIGKSDVPHDMSGCSPRHVFPTTCADVPHDIAMSWGTFAHVVGNTNYVVGNKNMSWGTCRGEHQNIPDVMCMSWGTQHVVGNICRNVPHDMSHVPHDML